MIQKKRSKQLRFQKKPINLNRLTYLNPSLHFGRMNLLSKDTGRVTKKQIESVRRTLTRFLKKKNKVWVRSRVNYPVTAKPQGIRMGKGKGAISQKIKILFPNSSLIEVSRYKKYQINLFKKGVKKLPINTKLVWKTW